MMHVNSSPKRFRIYKVTFLGILSSIMMMGSQAFAQQAESTDFGLLVMAPHMSIEQKIGLSKELGVSYIRSIASTTAMKNNANLVQYKNAGFKILLNVIDSPKSDVPTQGVTDLAKFQQNLSTILDAYHPDLLVVENEEGNLQFFVGTPQQYLAELQAAIDVAHPKGIKVAEGGLLQGPIAFLTWKDLWESGKHQQAEAFAHQAFAYGRKPWRELLHNFPTRAEPNKRINFGKELSRSIAVTEELLAGFKNMDVDYVNLHWYQSDERASPAVATISAYMTKATGKPVISNEFGQLDKSAENLVSLMQVAKDSNWQYAVWADIDAHAPNGLQPGEGDKAYALHDPMGALRPNGVAFRNFMTGKAALLRKRN